VTNLDLERNVGRYADAAVTAATMLLDQGATLDELIAVVADTEQGPGLTVGPVCAVLEDAPDLLFMLSLVQDDVPVGYLRWIAMVGPDIAWGSFCVAPKSRVEA
jgi:hypothetical protein